MLLQGKRLGEFDEFEIVECIGQGGMGAVYRAVQTSLQRSVAIKTLQPALAANPNYVERFHREAVAAARLSHQNLVQVHAAGETDGIHWFAMEFVEGESAQARLKRDGRMDPEEVIAIGLHVANALGYAWDRAGLIHRDIKPGNIFLSGHGDVKLGDLGLAKLTEQDLSITASGAVMGTPHYMSPEQAEGRKDVDLRADIYSLGCTLYDLLCGQPPYAGASGVAVLMKHVSAPPPDIRSVFPACPPALAEAILKMMQKDPSARQQSYEELGADLRGAHGSLSGGNAGSVKVKDRSRAAEPLTRSAARPSGKPSSTGALPVTPRSVDTARPAGAKRRASLTAWVTGGVALLAAIAALVHFLPRKAVSPLAGKERGEKQNAAENGGPAGSETGGKPAAEPIAVANNRQPDAVTGTSTPAPIREASRPSTPAPPGTPAPTQQVASSPTPTPSATPKPASEIEKWLAQVDGPQQQAFQKQVLKPFEAGVADLRAHYLAALDADIGKASAAGQLADALAWRKERQAFEKAKNVAEDDDATPAGVKTLRAAFRQELAKLDQERMSKAKGLFDQYAAILAKNEKLLTQNQHLDDALLLKNKREEIALEWLAASPIIGVGDAAAAGRPQAEELGPAKGPISPTTTIALSATMEQPFVNTLGMKFVPVAIASGPTAGQKVLCGVWDTRVRDYKAFATVNKVNNDWTKQEREGVPVARELDHPVTGVSWDDAQAFCRWLTKREIGEHKLPEGMQYRLPTDEEWSWAAGIPAEEGATPLEKQHNGLVKFVWGGKEYSLTIGNYADDAFHAKFPKSEWISGYMDGYPTTSPVGSFSANALGLYDMGGNVWQWCEDWYDASHKAHALRGGSWSTYVREGRAPWIRRAGDLPSDTVGFRCVLSVSAR